MTVLLFLGVAAAVFLGTVYPALVELVWGQQVALDATFYNRVFGPLALLLVLTLGVCPALFWGRTPPARLLARLRPGLAGGVLAAVAALAFGAQEAAALVGLGAVGFALGTVLSDMARTMAARCAGKGSRGSRLSRLWIDAGGRHIWCTWACSSLPQAWWVPLSTRWSTT